MFELIRYVTVPEKNPCTSVHSNPNFGPDQNLGRDHSTTTTSNTTHSNISWFLLSFFCFFCFRDRHRGKCVGRVRLSTASPHHVNEIGSKKKEESSNTNLAEFMTTVQNEGTSDMASPRTRSWRTTVPADPRSNTTDPYHSGYSFGKRSTGTPARIGRRFDRFPLYQPYYLSG